MKIYIIVASILAASVSHASYPSYSSLRDAGYYFSPGFDCMVVISPSEIVFSATKNEDEWAIFEFKKIPLATSITGYRLRALTDSQNDGETINCKQSLDSVEGVRREIIEFDRIYATDADEPSYLTYIFRRNRDGDFVMASCGWAFAPALAKWNGADLVVEYEQRSGKNVEIKALGSSECVVAH